jgi:hypothetical protein
MKTRRIKYTSTARCPCGGQVWYDGRYRKRLPLGLGFSDGSAKFRIDSVEIKGWFGQCAKCKSKIEAEVSRRHVTRFPASINRKIAQAQRLEAA